MADTAENLRTKLLADGTIAGLVGTHIHQGTVPQNDLATFPYIWFARSSRRLDRVLDEAAGAASDEEWFNVECVSDDLDESQDLAQAVRDDIECFRGTMGTQTVKAVFVEDQDDSYVPRNTAGENELHVAALSLQIFT
jgi:hypothetical protein